MGDIIRIGKIHTIDYARGTASVIYTDRNNEPSPSFPFFSFAYEMPKVDETVVVILLPNSTTKGFIVGVPWSGKKISAVSGQGIFYKEFSDGAFVKYDAKTKTMEISANKIKLQAVTAQSVTVTGQMKAKTVVAEKATIEELTVNESASFKDLTVSGTAKINNLDVSGTASGNFPECDCE